MWRTSNDIDWTLDQEKNYKKDLLNRLSTTRTSIKENFPWSEGLDKAIEELKTINPPTIIDDLINNDKIFDDIRQAQKKEGNIFLYGKPTPKVMDIMIKLYHENILRVLKGQYEYKKISKMMSGIIELDNGDIYVTLSESPYDGGNNSEYPKKIQDFYNLLINAGINVTYPEKEEQLKMFPMLESSNLFPSVVTEKWHESISNNYIYSPANLTINRVNYGNVLNEMFIEYDIKKLTTKIKINKILSDCKYEVKLIHSLDYLNTRKLNLNRSSENKNPFVPFTRIESLDPKYPQPYISCNNGSTCVESKLFSYIYDTLHLEFKNIAGFVSYWIGDNLPPNHIIDSYCYKSDRNKKKKPTDDLVFENSKLEKMLDDSIRFLSDPQLNDLPTCNIYKKIIDTQMEKYSPEMIHITMKNVVQPIALACPGCLSNYNYYTQNRRDQTFNYNICYGNWIKNRSTKLPPTSMEDMVSSGGGRIKTHRRKLQKRKIHRKKTQKKKIHRKKIHRKY